jgi:hypothetical protein
VAHLVELADDLGREPAHEVGEHRAHVQRLLLGLGQQRLPLRRLDIVPGLLEQADGSGDHAHGGEEAMSHHRHQCVVEVTTNHCLMVRPSREESLAG